MLAALGFPLAEQFHPLFGGSIDVPSYIAFQETPLQTFWPAVILTRRLVVTPPWHRQPVMIWIQT
mgnify:CR=1 FL=1